VSEEKPFGAVLNRDSDKLSSAKDILYLGAYDLITTQTGVTSPA